MISRRGVLAALTFILVAVPVTAQEDPLEFT